MLRTPPVVAMALPLLLLSGCAATSSTDELITFAVAGDSLTAWDDQTFPEPDGDLDPVTWTHWVIEDGLVLAGGYARGFASAREIADAMVAVDADILVVMVGTNDTGVTDAAAVFDAIDDIVRVSRVSEVLVSAIPPDDGFANEALAYNAKLEAFVESREWGWVDPWDGMRDGGAWVAGLSGDGVHPTAGAARDAGAIIVAAIREQLAVGE
jgi:lysophospholipase L1-like esterase